LAGSLASAFVDCQRVHRAPICAARLVADARQRLGRAAGGPQVSLPVPVRHRGDAADEIAEVVRQVGVVPLVVSLPREVAVTAKRDFLRQVQPQRIGAQARRRLDRIDRGAKRLAHPLAVERHEPVAEDLPRQRQLRGHQHRRPDDGMKPRDVLAYHVQVGGPPPFEHRLIRPEPDR
jgi:hypothetical protein